MLVCHVIVLPLTVFLHVTGYVLLACYWYATTSCKPSYNKTFVRTMKLGSMTTNPTPHVVVCDKTAHLTLTFCKIIALLVSVTFGYLCQCIV